MYESQLTQLAQPTFKMESALFVTEHLRSTMAAICPMQQDNKELEKQCGRIDIDETEAWAPCFAEFDP